MQSQSFTFTIIYEFEFCRHDKLLNIKQTKMENKIFSRNNKRITKIDLNKTENIQCKKCLNSAERLFLY